MRFDLFTKIRKTVQIKNGGDRISRATLLCKITNAE